MSLRSGNGHLSLLIALLAIFAAAPLGASMCPPGGAFSEFSRVLVGPPGTFACAVSDLDQDGFEDAVFLSIDANLRVKLGGALLSGTSEYSYSAPAGGHGLVLSDLDADGLMDIVMSGNSGLSVLRGVGTSGVWSGTFSTPSTIATVPDARRLAVADFDGDGITDVAVGSLNGSDVAVHRGTGAGAFGPAEMFAAGEQPFSVTAADFNEDGRQDIAVATLGGSLSILLGAGTPGHLDFSSSGTYAASGQLLDIAVADFNGDDILDIGLANAGDRVSVFLGLGAGGVGNGTFGAIHHFAVDTTPYGLAAADVDGDGIMDMVSGNNGSTTASLLRGVGDGSFRTVENYETGTSGTDVALMDVTGDGACDLIVAGGPSGVILQGQCPGTPLPPVVSGFTPSGGDVGDHISIFGSAIAAATNVTLGGIECPIVPGPAYPLVVTVPLGATTGIITVTTTAGSSSTADSFFVGPHPSIASVDPIAGRVGQTVMIRGQHFERVTRCSFGGQNSAPFVVNSPDEILATVDSTAITGLVHVFTRTGDAVSPVPFTVLPPDSAAHIVSVRDVAHDQGGLVVVKWRRSEADVARSNAIAGYRVWRRASLGDASLATRSAVPQKRIQDGSFWEAIGEIPAAHLSGYAFTATTPQDSLESGPGWTAFFIQTLTYDPTVFYSSNTDSGYSVDNLAPPVPLPFLANYSLTSVALHWTPSRAPDFREFRLHRSPFADFVPDASNLVIATRDTGHVDEPGGAFYYKLLALDVHGNVSRVASVSPTHPVAALATAREATTDGRTVRLLWSTSATPAQEVTIHRRTDRTGWQDVAARAVDGSGDLAWLDEDVQAGERYGYRLTWSQDGEPVTSGEVWVEVAMSRLEVAGVHPNPARRATGFTLSFSLRSDEPATIEVYDLGGRRVAGESLRAPRSGQQELRIRDSEGLPPGVYLVQLRQGADKLVTRAAIVQ